MSADFPETTDLERRVLAHEKVLQALIANMARTESRFIDHLPDRFVEPMRLVRHQPDHRETDDHAKDSIRAVMLLGEARARQPKDPAVTDERRASPEPGAIEGPTRERPALGDRVQVSERNGIWEVKADGKFRGHYHQKEHALAAAASLKLSLR